MCVILKAGWGGGGGLPNIQQAILIPQKIWPVAIFCMSLERAEESCPTMKSAYRGDKLLVF